MTNILTVLESVNGASFVGIDTRTEPALKGGKKNPHKGAVTKVTRGASVMAFSNKNSNGYENMVKRRLEAEGKNPDTFVLSPRSWGERIPGLPLVRHEKDGAVKYYLEVIFLKSGKSHFELNGQVIAREDVIGLEEKDESQQGGLSDDNKVIIRTFSLDSITAVRIDGQEFTGPFTCDL